MADTGITPTEYERTPDYSRPLGGIVRVMERLLKLGMTQREAIKPES